MDDQKVSKEELLISRKPIPATESDEAEVVPVAMITGNRHARRCAVAFERKGAQRTRDIEARRRKSKQKKRRFPRGGKRG